MGLQKGSVLESRVNAEWAEGLRINSGVIKTTAILGATALFDSLTTLLGFTRDGLMLANGYTHHVLETNPLVSELIESYGRVPASLGLVGAETIAAGLVLLASQKAKHFGTLVKTSIYLLSLSHMGTAISNLIIYAHPDGSYNAVEAAYVAAFRAFNDLTFNALNGLVSGVEKLF